MTQSNSMESLMNALLGNDLFGKTLSESEKATVRDMVQSLTGEIQAELREEGTDPAHDSDNETEPIADLGAMLAKLGGVAEFPGTPPDKDLLRQQTDITLIDALSEHVESANTVIEVLATRPVDKQAIAPLLRVELQLTALAIGVSDLRQAMEREIPRRQSSRYWKRRVKALLLREFNFINRWVR